MNCFVTWEHDVNSLSIEGDKMWFCERVALCSDSIFNRDLGSQRERESYVNFLKFTAKPERNSVGLHAVLRVVNEMAFRTNTVGRFVHEMGVVLVHDVKEKQWRPICIDHYILLFLTITCISQHTVSNAFHGPTRPISTLKGSGHYCLLSRTSLHSWCISTFA